MLSPKTSLILGALLGFLSVALGAFGAHALKDALIQQGRLATYETAVQYQMYHALALAFHWLLYWASSFSPDLSTCFAPPDSNGWAPLPPSVDWHFWQDGFCSPSRLGKRLDMTRSHRFHSVPTCPECLLP
jgi:hypothetical protein